ncbi:hypothetical protein TSUD_282720 [Trifolium subterraneum]|uniref:SMP-30/Gluconolactonase/LRE-like region domain-containing protein n=1 Tax=Trifolium subterraneum TaxID=3900 RepID=A0A2Z6PF64_TRISU|nr:hypothetical protein TSUD_282720 [Trifolium subterraneum]
MTKKYFMLLFAIVVLFGLLSPTSATPPPAMQHSRSMVKFESGYNVETIFDGSKLGIEPYSIEISPDGEFLVLDSESSNIYKISSPMSKYSKPKLLAGSSEGYIGHIDGRPRDARLNHPKGITVDDSGNIYIADTLNMAIRKISDEVYVRTSCSLLVVDRGNHAIREIQLNQHDCMTTTTNDEYEFDNSIPLGIAALICAGFFGYMLALLKRRVKDMFSSSDDSRAPINIKGTPFVSQQRPPPKSVRPPLIPNEDEFEKHDEVQEHDGRREAMVIKAVDYGDPKFSHHNIRPRLNYVGYSHNY